MLEAAVADGLPVQFAANNNGDSVNALKSIERRRESETGFIQ
jgi:hypothetical protein